MSKNGNLFNLSFSLFSNIFLCVILFQCKDWITWFLWYHDYSGKVLELFCIFFIYTFLLLASNLFHLVLFSLLNSHSFVTSECYLTSFCLFVCFVLEFFFVGFFLSTVAFSFLFTILSFLLWQFAFSYFATISVAVKYNNMVRCSKI